MMISRQKLVATGLCAIMILSVSFAPKTAGADNTPRERPIRLVSNEWADPIGKVVDEFQASGTLTINGRAAHAAQPIWDGDLLQTHDGISVPVFLDSIGIITLRKGTVVRLATGRGLRDGSPVPPEMIALLALGEVSIKLRPAANARIRAGGSAFVSSRGAAFSASFREGVSLVTVKSGEVRKDEKQAGRDHQYTIKPVGHGSNIHIPASETRQIQVQVIEDGLPVPDVAVLFVLDISGAVNGQLGVGTLSNSTLSVVTNSNGIAAVQFVAGPTSGTVPVSATIEGTRTSWNGEITVTSRGGGSHKLGWTIFALIGTAAAAGVAYALTRDRDSLKVQPPVAKNP